MGNEVDVPAYLAVVTRCRETVDAMASGAVESHDVSSFLADLSTLPAGHPQRGELAATMVTLLTRGGGSPPLGVMGDLGALLDLVDIAPPHLLAWPQARAAARAFQLAHEVQSEKTTAAAATTELDELTAQQQDFPPTLRAIEAALRAMQLSTAMQRGDESSQLGITGLLGTFIERIGDMPQAGPMREMQALLQELMRVHRTGEWAAIGDVLERMRSSKARLPLDPAVWRELDEIQGVFRALNDPPPDLTGLTPDEVVRKFGGDTTSTSGKFVASYMLLDGGDETDLGRIDRAIQLTREVAAGDGHMRDIARHGVALGLWRKAQVLGTTEGLDEAVRVLEDLLRDLGGSGHPQWTTSNHLLAEIKRRVDDQHGSGAAGLEAMLRFAHQALVESDPAAARNGLRKAAAMGMDFARQRVSAGDFAGALHVLDTGRGLMLFAEVEMLDIAPRLRAAGRPDLARRWTEEGQSTPGLRAEAIEVLVADAGGIDKLLTPPSPAEIRTALTTVDADALVYLVPADQQQPGMALVVPREGPMAYLPLTYLSVGQETGVEGYLAALSRLSRELAPVAQAPFTDRLDGLCEWAWRVAIGPLLDRYFARDAKKRGRVPRIVLIPMAELAAIPWQAARNREGTYAIELAAFSQAVSAREFCVNAARPPVRLTSTGLVVGDPREDLPAARVEAYEIHKAFLRAAKYVGRGLDGKASRSGPGTAEQVRAWLTADGPQAGAVLHLACHGQFTSEERAAKACLVLAPNTAGNSGELGADEIVRLLHSTPDRQIGLVVMAACHTGRSIHGYDEAYSLGTAFLVGGVRTVLSTQWAVPDEATSTLMYLFHHYLRTEKLPPWQALRAAQLSMLRPDTPTPDILPTRLRELVADREHVGVVGWAGFVHGGH